MKPYVVVSCCTESMRPVAELTFPTHAEFCRRQGIHLDHSLAVPEENAIWGKIDAIRRHLTPDGPDKILWIDADAAITNPDLGKRFEILDQIDDVALTCDAHGLNAGVMLMRNTPAVRALFYAVAGYGRNVFKDWVNPEQQALRYFLTAPPYDKLAVYVPQKALNAYWPGAYDYPGAEEAHWEPGDFILHLPGLPHERRVEILKRALSVSPG